MNTKKIVLTSAVAVFFAITSVSPAIAQTVTPTPTSPATTRGMYRQDVKNARQTFKTDVKTDREELKETVQTERKEIGKNIREKIASGAGMLKKIITGRAVIGMGTVTSISGSTLTLTQDSKTYTVNTGTFDKCTTQFRRRFWGSSSISEISVNDKVNVFGLWTDDSKTTVNACLVRDISIQKRFGVFFGNVISITSTGFTMSTKSGNRANQTVTISSTTSVVNRKEAKIGLSDIQIGNLVRVSGMWDNQANTVTEVKTVKDFTIPIVPTPTPKS